MSVGYIWSAISETASTPVGAVLLSGRMTEADLTALEAQLAAMTEQEVVRFYNGLEVDDPRVDVVAGEMKRRNIDL